MTKYAEFDGSGNIIGFYDSVINETIPEDSIEITAEQWQFCLENPGKKIVTADVLVDASGATLLQIAKDIKKGELSELYANAIVANFTSSALGAPHTYAGDFNSQTLLNNLITAGNTANYPYFNAGVFTSASHTLAQLNAVLDDLITAQQAAIANYSTKAAAVNAAANIGAVNAITW